jgi:DNA-binding NarL/FixJ family response regulator
MTPVAESLFVDAPDPFEASSSRRRILLVEDHPVVSRGITKLISYEPDLQICAIAEDCASALHQIDVFRPDLVILDLSLKTGSGLDLLKEIKKRHLLQRVLILSMHDETVYAPRALQAGASGYVMKQETGDTLLQAIRHVIQNGHYLSKALTATTLSHLPRGQMVVPDLLQDLTDRELQVLRLIGRGLHVAQIAEQLGVGVKTIEVHRTRVKQKLNLKSVAALVQRAMELQPELNAKENL